MSDLERHLTSEVDGASPAEPPGYADVLARRDRRRGRRRAVLVSAGAVVLVVGVLGGTATLRSPDRVPTATLADPPGAAAETGAGSRAPEVRDVPPSWDGRSAPPVVLQLGGRAVRLEPWTACFTGRPDKAGMASGGCFDGFPQAPLEDVGERESVAFSFPLKGWSFEATFSPPGDGRCERRTTVAVEKTGAYTFAVPTAGPPGDYHVDVFGRGPGGDVITSFAWSTSEAGPLPAPSGHLSYVSDEDDRHVAYGLELALQDLARSPREASVTLVVTAADGSRRTVGPVAAAQSCGGTAYFREDREGIEPFDLGPAPFTYRAEVTLDGTTYVGTAVWPRDENDEPPYTDLTFSPPLPAYTG